MQVKKFINFNENDWGKLGQEYQSFREGKTISNPDPEKAKCKKLNIVGANSETPYSMSVDLFLSKIFEGLDILFRADASKLQVDISAFMNGSAQVGAKNLFDITVSNVFKNLELASREFLQTFEGLDHYRPLKEVSNFVVDKLFMLLPDPMQREIFKNFKGLENMTINLWDRNEEDKLMPASLNSSTEKKREALKAFFNADLKNAKARMGLN